MAGGPNGESCGNSQHTPGGSIHHFPDREKEPQRYMQWIRFVRWHRPNWVPGNQAILCGIHFEKSCFTVNWSIAKSLRMKLKLQKDAIPTIDAANEITETRKLPPREQRKVCRVVTCQTCRNCKSKAFWGIVLCQKLQIEFNNS